MMVLATGPDSGPVQWAFASESFSTWDLRVVVAVSAEDSDGNRWLWRSGLTAPRDPKHIDDLYAVLDQKEFP